MSTLAKALLRNGALTLAVGGLGVGAYAAWMRYGALDPYAKAVKPPKADPNVSMSARGVEIRRYENGKLVVGAKADLLKANADRSQVTLRGIHDAVANTPQGTFHVAAQNGTLQPNLKALAVSGAVRVTGKGKQGPFDFRTAVAKLDGRKGVLSVPTTLRGTVGGGQLVAGTLEYRPNSDYLHLTNVAARGKPPQDAGLPASQAGAYWDFASEDFLRKGPSDAYKEARAEDGKMIVMAPSVTHNRRTDVLTATGRATYRSAKADFVADTIVVYRKEGRAEFKGNVVMLVHPKKHWDDPLPKNAPGPQPLEPKLPGEPAGAGDVKRVSPEEKKRDDDLRSGKTLREYPMNLKAAEVTYWYKEGDRRAVAKGGDPTAYQSFEDGRWWRQAKASEARYDGEKDMLELLGDGANPIVKLKNSLGDWLDSTWMKLSTKEEQTEDDEYVESKGNKGHSTVHDDDETKGGDKDKKAPPAKTEPPAKTGP